jgi:hypothetical protein
MRVTPMMSVENAKREEMMMDVVELVANMQRVVLARGGRLS